MVLDVATQSEEQGENRIHLACSKIEDNVPQSLLKRCRLRERIEIQMFEKVDDDDSHDGEAAEAVNDVDTTAAGTLFHDLSFCLWTFLQRYA